MMLETEVADNPIVKSWAETEAVMRLVMGVSVIQLVQELMVKTSNVIPVDVESITVVSTAIIVVYVAIRVGSEWMTVIVDLSMLVTEAIAVEVALEVIMCVIEVLRVAEELWWYVVFMCIECREVVCVALVCS